MRENLIRLAISYGGDYRKIRKAIMDGETADSAITVLPAITIEDSDYPIGLRKLRYPPYVLFYQGHRQWIQHPMVAVIGSRQAEAYGVEMTQRVVRQLRSQYTIVSGMAKGIDAIAHQTALQTVGVLGCGLDICYPPENTRLYQYMRVKQLLISEYPPTTLPQAQHFPFRNRIIAALSQSVVVTQARFHSGTMHTVSAALNLGKDVYAVPYRADDLNGEGCNALIADGAGILEWNSEKGSFSDFI